LSTNRGKKINAKRDRIVFADHLDQWYTLPPPVFACWGGHCFDDCPVSGKMGSKGLYKNVVRSRQTSMATGDDHITPERRARIAKRFSSSRGRVDRRGDASRSHFTAPGTVARAFQERLLSLPSCLPFRRRGRNRKLRVTSPDSGPFPFPCS
jgi:hypothetical protein